MQTHISMLPSAPNAPFCDSTQPNEDRVPARSSYTPVRVGRRACGPALMLGQPLKAAASEPTPVSTWPDPPWQAPTSYYLPCRGRAGASERKAPRLAAKNDTILPRVHIFCMKFICFEEIYMHTGNRIHVFVVVRVLFWLIINRYIS